MKAKVKTVLKGFDYMHCDDFAKYLSDMSAKGWHFKEWGAGLKFEKGEPEHAIYTVEIFPKASENDMRPEPSTQEFAEYCESAGWKFIDAKQKICIFKKIDPNAVELYTPEERVNNAVKGSFSLSSIMLLILYGINSALRWGSLSSMFEGSIFSNHFFFQISIWTVMFIGQLVILLYAFYKSFMLKRKVRLGEKIYIGNRQDGRYHVNIRDIYVILLIVLLMYYFFMIDQVALLILNAAILVGTIGFVFVINKVRPERDTNIVIQVAFSIVLMMSIVFFTMMIFMENGDDSKLNKESIPLLITDYRECDDVIEDTAIYVDRNFLGTKETYYIFGKKESIYYNVYKSEYTWILDRIWEEEFTEKKFNVEVVDCTADWGAKKAFRNNNGNYFVRYENSILIFSDDENVSLSEEQTDIIIDKLELR